MIKSVAKALPNYAMNVFLLPKYFVALLEQLYCDFLWGGKDKNHWMSWSRLCHRKDNGGLNFRRLHEFNLALIGKQVWRMLTDPNILIARVFKAQYFSNMSFFETTSKQNDSFVWRFFLASKDLIRKGFTWRIGDGVDIAI